MASIIYDALAGAAADARAEKPLRVVCTLTDLAWLAEQVGGEVRRVAAAIVDDQDLARTGDHIDAYFSKNAALRGGHKSVAGPCDFIDRLYRAVFAQGLNIGDRETLTGLAASSGLDFARTDALLRGDANNMTVQAMDTNHRLQGVLSVPHYVFNARVAVAGVQDTDTLITALDYALFQPMPEIGDRANLH